MLYEVNSKKICLFTFRKKLFFLGPNSEEKKKRTQKLHAHDTTFKINILLRQQAHFPFPIATFLQLGTEG